MSLSRREETESRYPGRSRLEFDTAVLAGAIQQQAPEVDFAYLLGSAQEGVVSPYSDVDVAVYFRPGFWVGFESISRVMTVVEDTVELKADADVSVLNNAHVVFRFEALRGLNLFVRAEATERYVEFYTRTCREYDQYMLEMERNRRLRARTTTTMT